MGDQKHTLVELWEWSRGICALCNAEVPHPSMSTPGSPAPQDATRDHIIPAALGGAASWRNYRLACRACNEGRQDAFPFKAVRGLSHKIQNQVWKRHRGCCASCSSWNNLQFISWPDGGDPVVMCTSCTDKFGLNCLRSNNPTPKPRPAKPDWSTPPPLHYGPLQMLTEQAVRQINPAALRLAPHSFKRLLDFRLIDTYDEPAAVQQLTPRIQADLIDAPIKTDGLHYVHGPEFTWKISCDGAVLHGVRRPDTYDRRAATRQILWPQPVT